MDLAPGTMVTDKVRLVRELAGGSMGIVWVADHLTLDTQVAVKFLSEDLDQGDPLALARFEREARASAKVRSPHVAQTFDHGVTDSGRPYIVMELLEGESIVERLESSGPLEPGEVLQIIEQVGSALTAAHAQGIVHRDVKPGNVFLMNSGSGFFCKLLDFGIAKPQRAAGIAGLTETGTIIGTPEFMSPEQLMDPTDVDESADLWALAATAYCALTDQVPFDGPSLGALCVKVLNAEFTPPRRHRDELAATVDAWFARAMSLRPGARFADPEEMRRTFELAIAGEDFDDGPAPQVEDPDQTARQAAVEAAHRAHVATFSGSASDASPKVELPLHSRSNVMYAAVGVAAIVGAVALFTLRDNDEPTPRTPSMAPATDAPTLASPVHSPAGDPKVATKVPDPTPTTVASDTTPTAEPSVEIPLPKLRQPRMPPATTRKRKGAAPGDPGF